MNKRAFASLVVTFALIFVHFQLWNRYAINIPKWDDHALKATVENFEKAKGLGAKLYEIYRQHNEHRISLTRLVAVLDYKIFGHLNYEHLMLFGNLALLLIWWILTRFFKLLSGAVWYALPISTFWFSLAFWENAYWGMAAIQKFLGSGLGRTYFLAIEPHRRLLVVGFAHGLCRYIYQRKWPVDSICRAIFIINSETLEGIRYLGYFLRNCHITLFLGLSSPADRP
ncbi:MAG: hypothetical protein R2822_06815 [Spirosomataceae bacterium]